MNCKLQWTHEYRPSTVAMTERISPPSKRKPRTTRSALTVRRKLSALTQPAKLGLVICATHRRAM